MIIKIEKQTTQANRIKTLTFQQEANNKRKLNQNPSLTTPEINQTDHQNSRNQTHRAKTKILTSNQKCPGKNKNFEQNPTERRRRDCTDNLTN